MVHDAQAAILAAETLVFAGLSETSAEEQALPLGWQFALTGGSENGKEDSGLAGWNNGLPGQDEFAVLLTGLAGDELELHA